MSDHNREESLEDILDNLDTTHAEAWDSYKRGKMTLGAMFDLVEQIHQDKSN